MNNDTLSKNEIVSRWRKACKEQPSKRREQFQILCELTGSSKDEMKKFLMDNQFAVQLRGKDGHPAVINEEFDAAVQEMIASVKAEKEEEPQEEYECELPFCTVPESREEEPQEEETTPSIKFAPDNEELLAVYTMAHSHATNIRDARLNTMNNILAQYEKAKVEYEEAADMVRKLDDSIEMILEAFG